MFGDDSGNRLRNLKNYSRKIKFNDFEPGASFYYYPLHLEPEAVVLDNGGGLYENQKKLIKNIASQLPPGNLLYVKDHSHDFDYRACEDFEKLQVVPNIRLIKNNVPGKLLINHAVGVISINGTAGFEALLMGKQVYKFGESFYQICPRVKYIHDVRKLRDIIYRNRDIEHNDDEELHCFTAAYLHSAAPGVVDYFVGRALQYGIDLNRNIQLIPQDLVRQSEKA